MFQRPIPSVNHRVLAVYDDEEASVFALRRNATLSELCEQLALRAPHPGAVPQHVEVNLAR
jgi:hypothetical protein